MAAFRRKPGRAPARVKIGADGMNGLERDYSAYLQVLVVAGEIQTWRFERITFRLAFRCRYTPDFEVVLADGTLEYHEVKGRWMEDARVKIKVAANLFRDRVFLAVRRPKKRDGFQFETIQPDAV